jgi:hypothetical protein
MESVLAAIVSVALILLAALTASQGTLSSTSLLSESWKAMEERSGEISRTEIEASGVSVLDNGATVEATIANRGSVRLNDFEEWDLALQYYDDNGDYRISWLPYTSSAPGNNQWTVGGIYLAGTTTPEVYEPGILNPGEEMVVQVKPDPAVGKKTTNQLVVGTPNGVTTSVIFVRN